MNIQTPQPEDRKSAAVRAGGSSFYLAMRILGRDQRQAMFEVYSFCRAVDDTADGDAPRHRRLAELAQWRQNIDALYAGTIPPGLTNLAHAVGRFSLHKSDFLDMIAGMEMDAAADIRAPSFTQLELYCDRVASAVGRLSVRIFGMEDEAGRQLAHHLGLALQLTNILRDIDEDAGMGRLYLPREALELADIPATDPATVILNPRIGTACGFIVERAREHFVQSDAIMSRCPRRVVRAPKIMGKVYRQMLEDMVARGWLRPRRRVHVPKSHLLWIALRYAFV